MEYIEKKVHDLYWNQDVNCARTTLTCLGELFGISVAPQTMDAAMGMHGAGGFRAQCGLVEGGLMFIGIYFRQLGEEEKTVVSICRDYALAFTEKFGSLRCRELRPDGFTSQDPPHLCENLTCEAITFTYEYIKRQKRECALEKKFLFRSILPEEKEQAAQIETVCFPPNEACSREMMLERAQNVSELFLVAVDRETGRLAGFLNGVSTDEEAFRDEFFTDASLYDPDGKNVMLLGLDVLPEYRMQGVAGKLMALYQQREREKGRKKLLLTCVQEKVEMYRNMGFHDEGISNSFWGGHPWHEMSCLLKPQTEEKEARGFVIRREQEKDYEIVEEIHREAFWNQNVPGCNEHYFAHILRAHGDFVPELDYVCEMDGQVVGNVMYTKSCLVDEQGKRKEILTFGPIGVKPEFQRRGIGKAMLEKSFEQAAQMGYGAIVIFGNPDNYVARGFKSCKKYQVCLEENVFPSAMLVKELKEGFFDGRTYYYHESPAFQADDSAAEEFEKGFPYKEKAWTPSQEEFYIHSHSVIR